MYIHVHVHVYMHVHVCSSDVYVHVRRPLCPLQAHKKTPGLEKGFLVQVVRYALNRLQSLNEFCVICDEKHVLETGLIKVGVVTGCLLIVTRIVTCTCTRTFKEQYAFNEYLKRPKFRWMFYVILSKSVATLDMSVYTCMYMYIHNYVHVHVCALCSIHVHFVKVLLW